MRRTSTSQAIGEPAEGKESLDIDEVFRRLRLAVEPHAKAAMFDLRDRGFSSPFEQLVGSLISARTRHATTLTVCLRLLALARTAEAMAKLSEPELDVPPGRGGGRPMIEELFREFAIQWGCAARVATPGLSRRAKPPRRLPRA